MLYHKIFEGTEEIFATNYFFKNLLQYDKTVQLKFFANTPPPFYNANKPQIVKPTLL